tara:strand:+ start:832 stop:1053 length:222 start_codon:yes stop_codon:yes gene_type:complete
MRTIHIRVNDRTSDYDETKKRVEPYLYSNFSLAENREGWPELVVVHGHDQAGWTAEAQTARLQSGLIAAEVIA